MKNRRDDLIRQLSAHIVAIKPLYEFVTAYSEFEARKIAEEIIDDQMEFLRRNARAQYSVVSSRLYPNRPLVLVTAQNRSLYFPKKARLTK